MKKMFQNIFAACLIAACCPVVGNLQAQAADDEIVPAPAPAPMPINNNVIGMLVNVWDGLRQDRRNYIVGHDVISVDGREVDAQGPIYKSNDGEDAEVVIFLFNSDEDGYHVSIENTNAEILVICTKQNDGRNFIPGQIPDPEEMVGLFGNAAVAQADAEAGLQDPPRFQDEIENLRELDARQFVVTLKNSEVRHLYILNGVDQRMYIDLNVGDDEVEIESLEE